MIAGGIILAIVVIGGYALYIADCIKNKNRKRR